MMILGFAKNDLLKVKAHYEELAERYKDKPETHAGYVGRSAMLRDLIWNWDAYYHIIKRGELAAMDIGYD